MLLNILYTILNTQGTNAKKDLVKQWYEKDSQTCAYILKYLYDPNIKTNLSLKKINKSLENIWKTCDVKELTDKDIYELITYLTTVCTGKDTDISVIQDYINNYQYSVPKEFFQLFCCKELSLGIDIKTINSVIPNCIPIYDPMLATNVTNVIDKLDLSNEYVFTMKLDGNRCLIDTTVLPYKAISRNGVDIEGLEEFLAELKNTLPKGYIFDGELLPQETEGVISSEQYKIISSIMRTKGIKDKNKICYNVFDFFSEDKKYSERRELLEKNIKDTKYCKVVKVLHKGKIDKYVFDLLDKVTNEGQEGLMANDVNGLYEHKRTKSILKFKKFHDVDLKCIDVEEGTKKYKGKLGAILCEYKGNITKVGSGFTDEERILYWNDPSNVLGKIVKIKYFEESKDKNGLASLRFPVFTEIREDKTEVSYD